MTGALWRRCCRIDAVLRSGRINNNYVVRTPLSVLESRHMSSGRNKGVVDLKRRRTIPKDGMGLTQFINKSKNTGRNQNDTDKDLMFGDDGIGGIGHLLQNN